MKNKIFIKICGTGYICSYNNDFPLTERICTENGYVVLNDYKELITWDSYSDWNISRWCRENLEKFPETAKEIIFDGLFLSNDKKENFRIITRDDLIKLFYEIKDLKTRLIKTIPEFFPENIFELSQFELKYTDVWRNYIKSHFTLPDADDPHQFHHIVQDAFVEYYMYNPETAEKLKNLKFGNHTLEECTWSIVEWIFDLYEKLSYILGDSNIKWNDPKFFFMEK